MVLASKNGIPLASLLDRSEKNESFGALTATIFGASDVILTSFDKSSPTMVEINSKDTVLLVKEVGNSAVLAVMGASSGEKTLITIINSVSEEIENSTSFKR